jgi:hypothetical protein
MLEPADTDIRVVLPDIHGNFEAMRQLLISVGAIDEDDQRQPGFFIVQLGDLIHGGHDITEADAMTLELAEKWVDVWLLGNHELPFVTSIVSDFVGLHRQAGSGHLGQHPSCQLQLNRAMREGRLRAAFALDGWLIAHAGLNVTHIHNASWGDDIHAAALISSLNPSFKAVSFMAAINERFEERLTSGERDLIIDGVSTKRGGFDAVGSIFWADAREVVAAAKRYGNPVPQIIGHTPRSSKHLKLYRPKRFALPSKRGYGRAPIYAIDLAGIDNGYIGCLTKHANESEWSPHVIVRPPRPLHG